MKQQDRYKKLVKIAAYSAVVFAVIQIFIKLYAWFVTDASALLASATDSLLDVAASVINLAMLSIALMPADENHRFGHGKAESLTGLFQSAFVLGSAALLIIYGIQKFFSPSEITQSEVGIVVSLIALVLTFILVIIQRWVIKNTGSVAIEADALHYQSDLLLNVGVLISLMFSQSIWPSADGLFTALVGVFLCFGAFKILSSSVNQLMDHELEGEELALVIEIVEQHSLAHGVHDIRSRRSGAMRFLQFHLELEDSLSLFDAHQASEDIRLRLEETLSPCEVLIHQDPISVVKEADKN